MKTKINSAIACSLTLLLFVLVAPAFAAPAVWTDSIDRSDSPVYISSSGQYNYHFDLNIAETGFNPDIDEVYSYSLAIGLADDGDRAGEWAFINLPGLLQDRIIAVNDGDYTFDMSVQGLANLNQTGVLGVDIYALWGDMNFLGAQLNAGGNSVPLPASLILLGTGLVALSGVRRMCKSSFSTAS